MDIAPIKPQTPEAEREFERFLRAYAEHAAAANKIALSILVWGSGPTRQSPIRQKREEILAELQDLGHNAMFSEDLPSVDPHASLKTQEFAQAMAADLIIILVEDSAGALGEAHDFCNHPSLAPKTFVLVPDAYRQGYGGQGALRDLEDAYGGVFWYTANDLQVCNVCSRAIRRAQALRNLRLCAGGVS